MIKSAVLLVHPVVGAPLRLTTDASDQGLGAVLEQEINKQWLPLGFFSHRLTPPEKNYSTFDKELTACFSGIRHFCHYLEATSFQLRTDHKPVVQACFRRGDPMSGRQLRQISYILEHTNQITHVDGIKNFVADALSRAPVSSASICSVPGLPVAAPSLEEFAAAQVKCKEVQALRSSTTLTVISKQLPSGQQLLIDVSTPSSRILVPSSLRQQVLNVVHELHHPGIRATRRLLRRNFIWPSMPTAAMNFVN